MNIRPTQNFVLIQFIDGDGTIIVLPEGARDPSGKILVVAVGPDVPKEPAIEPGANVLLRGDAKLYEGDSKKKMVLVDSRWITGVIEEESVLSDADIETIIASN